jgi:hypothetical protein
MKIPAIGRLKLETLRAIFSLNMSLLKLCDQETISQQSGWEAEAYTHNTSAIELWGVPWVSKRRSSALMHATAA